MKQNELPIVQKAYDLALDLFQMVERMPRSQRFTLGDRLIRNMIEVLELLTVVRYTQDKLGHLQEVNLLLERMRILLRLAKDIRGMSIKAYGRITGDLDEVGRMLGGWISHLRNKQV